MASLTRKLEAMELRKANGINTVPKIDEVCRIFDTMEHSTNEYPIIPAFKEVLHDQANAMNMVKKIILFPLFRDIQFRVEESPKF